MVDKHELLHDFGEIPDEADSFIRPHVSTENELYMDFSFDEAYSSLSLEYKAYRCNVGFKNITAELTAFTDMAMAAPAGSEYSIDPIDAFIDSPGLPVPGFKDIKDSNFNLASGVNAAYNIALNWHSGTLDQKKHPRVFGYGGKGTVLRTILFSLSNSPDVEWRGTFPDKKWVSSHLKSGQLHSFTEVVEPIGTYDVIVPHFGLAGAEKFADKLVTKHLAPSGIMLGVYANPLVSHLMETCPEYELLSIHGNAVTARVCGKTFVDEPFDMAAVSVGGRLTMDVGLRQFFTKDKWPDYAHRVYRNHMDKSVMKYFRIFICVNKDVSPPIQCFLNGEHPVLDTSSFTSHPTSPDVTKYEARHAIDHASPLTEMDVVNHFPTTPYSVKWKLDGSSAFMKITARGATILADGGTGFLVSEDITTEPGWELAFQLEQIDTMFYIRKILSYTFANRRLPVNNYHKNALLARVGAPVAKDVKCFECMTEQLKRGVVSGVPVDGVMFEQDLTSMNNVTHSTVVDGEKATNLTLLGTSRYFKIDPTVDIRGGDGTVYEYSIRDAAPIAVRKGKTPNDQVKIQRIKDMALKPMILAMIPVIGLVTRVEPVDGRKLKALSVSVAEGEASKARLAAAGGTKSVSKEQLSSFNLATAIFSVPVDKKLGLKTKASTWEKGDSAVEAFCPIIRAPAEVQKLAHLMSQAEISEAVDFACAEEAGKRKKREPPASLEAHRSAPGNRRNGGMKP